MAHQTNHLFATDPPWLWDGRPCSVSTAAKLAQKCPVCEGKTTMPANFYDPPTPGTSAPNITAPVSCRSCGGRGIVYGQETTG